MSARCGEFGGPIGLPGPEGRCACPPSQRPYRGRKAEPTWASWRVSGVPEPSRLPCMPDRSTGTPASVAPSAGPGPAQAMTRRSSPLRKRWQRTPPVALPFGGYSANGVTLTLATDAPGSAPTRPATVTTTVSPAAPEAGRPAPPAAGSDAPGAPIAPNQTTDAPRD